MATKTVINASELHRAAGKALKRVALNDEHLVVERDGYPIAVMMSYQEYDKLMRERAVILHRKLTRALGHEAERQNLTEEQLLDELDATRREVFLDTYGQIQL
jgi:PHD/YefM family antitoxin component YafN of YafNO toxin-antitoxin module